MGLPRSRYVKDDEVGVYHCTSRCVRRAFLCGRDPVTNRDFSHRKQWIVDRLQFLSGIFAIQVFSYSVLETHYHSILRTRPDIANTWSDLEVATRWVTLCPKHRKVKGIMIPIEDQIHALLDSPKMIAKLRKRLSSLSWFMGQINGFIARAANHEDNVKGRFWEARFKSTPLLDDAAIVACMTYVDLNLVRAGIAATPEESDFTSIQQRIRDWRKENFPDAAPLSTQQDTLSGPSSSASWLCPISPDPHQGGILQMTPAQYFDLVDRSGRIIRADKRGAIDADLKPILVRIGANPDAWVDTISCFTHRFRVAVGRPSSLRKFAAQVGQRWIVGVAAAHTAFT